MARFYGEIDGRRAKVHRLHHGPLTVRACSWRGGVQTTLYEVDGETWARVETIRWQGEGRANVVYDGPLATMQQATPAAPGYAAREAAAA